MNKKILIAGISTALIGASLITSKVFYKVTQVIDGDTFEVSNGQRIRLDSVNAPELSYCLSEESKNELSKLILNKKVYVKVNFLDNYKRLIGEVYTLNGNVGAKMLEKGMATFRNKGRLNDNDYLPYTNNAKNKKLGVFSEKCTQSTNPINPKCNIKGNVYDGNKMYHRPDCGQYKNTIVQLHLGDKWFCTERQAQKEGFKKGEDCK